MAVSGKPIQGGGTFPRGAGRLAVWLGLLMVLALGLGLGSGCAVPQTGRKLAWRTLSKGLVSGMTASERRVVRTEAEYFTLWADHAADAPRVALPPVVDFTREMVVVVALGNRPTGGYVVDVVDVELRGRTLRVLTGEREPRPGVLQIQQRTQPYVMIALPAMVARVDFREVREEELRGGRRKARPGVEGESVGGGVRGAENGGGGEDRGARVPVRGRAPVVPVQSPRGAAK